MEFADVIRQRYSCRKFDSREVPAEILRQVLDAGRIAPTTQNVQPQKIYVLHSKEVLAKFDSMNPCRYGAPIVVIVAYDKRLAITYPGLTTSSGREDATFVACHIMLAAKDAGLETCCTTFFEHNILGKELGISPHDHVVLAFALGYAAADSQPLPSHTMRKPISEILVLK